MRLGCHTIGSKRALLAKNPRLMGKLKLSAHLFPRPRARRKSHTPLAQQGFRRRGATEGLVATGLKPPGGPIACGGGRATRARLSRCTVRTSGGPRITFFSDSRRARPAPENGETRAHGHRAGRSRGSVPKTRHASPANRAHARERARPAPRGVRQAPVSNRHLRDASFLVCDIVPFLGRRMPRRGTGLRGGVDIHRATRARRGIGIAIRMGSAASPTRARSHERPVACLTRRPPPTCLVRNSRPKTGRTVCRFDRVFVFPATARIPDSSSSERPRSSAPPRQSTASWRRRERGRFPRF